MSDKKLTMKMRPISSLPLERQAEAIKNYKENIRQFERANELGFEDPEEAEFFLGPTWEEAPSQNVIFPLDENGVGHDYQGNPIMSTIV